MEKIISALIGCGRMGAFTSESIFQYAPPCWLPLSHIEALQAANNITVSGICDIDKENLKRVQQQYDIAHTYTDYRQLLDEIKPHLLCVATRTVERAEIIKAGIAAGVKAFHVEKPLCNSLQELNEIEAVVKKNNILLTYGAIRRYFPIYKQTKAIIQSGVLGELQQIQINFGRGSLFWTHPHTVDLILFFAGNKKLIATQAKLDNIITGDSDSYIESDPLIQSASLYFEGGLVGSISQAGACDVVLSCTKGELIIEGDGRSIFCRQAQDDDPYYTYPGSTVKLDEQPKNQGTYCAIEVLLKALDQGIENNRQNDIFLGQRVLFSFIQSAIQNSQLVELADINPDLFVLGKTGNKVA